MKADTTVIHSTITDKSIPQGDYASRIDMLDLFDYLNVDVMKGTKMEKFDAGWFYGTLTCQKVLFTTAHHN